MKIDWVGEVPGSSLEIEAQHVAYAKSLGLPAIKKYARPPLAVIGGGPSAVDHILELRGWAGDVWVSGSAFPWALSLGLIEPTFFTIDQSPQLAIDGKNAKKALLATCCNPVTFDSIGKHAKIEVFDLYHSGPNANHWSTTITAAPKVALDMGYRDVTFFGCDSSFRDKTHVYSTDAINDAIIVQCSGSSYVTRPSFVMQAEFMHNLFRIAPTVFKLRGDGLLAAMVKNSDYDVTHAIDELAARILKRAA